MAGMLLMRFISRCSILHRLLLYPSGVPSQIPLEIDLKIIEPLSNVIMNSYGPKHNRIIAK